MNRVICIVDSIASCQLTFLDFRPFDILSWTRNDSVGIVGWIRISCVNLKTCLYFLQIIDMLH